MPLFRKSTDAEIFRPCRRCGVRVAADPDDKWWQKRWLDCPTCLELHTRIKTMAQADRDAAIAADLLGEAVESSPAVSARLNDPHRTKALRADMHPLYAQPVTQHQREYTLPDEYVYTVPANDGSATRYGHIDRDAERKALQAERRAHRPGRNERGLGCYGCGIAKARGWYEAIGADAPLCQACLVHYQASSESVHREDGFGARLYTDLLGLRQTAMGQPSLTAHAEACRPGAKATPAGSATCPPRTAPAGDGRPCRTGRSTSSPNRNGPHWPAWPGSGRPRPPWPSRYGRTYWPTRTRTAGRNRPGLICSDLIGPVPGPVKVQIENLL